jgi:hypothetical protein
MNAQYFAANANRAVRQENLFCCVAVAEGIAGESAGGVVAEAKTGARRRLTRASLLL